MTAPKPDLRKRPQRTGRPQPRQRPQEATPASEAPVVPLGPLEGPQGPQGPAPDHLEAELRRDLQAARDTHEVTLQRLEAALAQANAEVAELRNELTAAQAQAHVTVELEQADPVGGVEICERLGVTRKGYENWRERNVGFPEPRWTVGGRPAWHFPDVVAWHEAYKARTAR